MANRVVVLKDVSIAPYGDDNRLHFQWCLFDLEDRKEEGYRFMWSEAGKLKALRGGARLPSWDAMQELLSMAAKGGWAGRAEAPQ